MDFGGTRVLDIYAGSGSLGIEALSRGAAHVTFVDSSSAAAHTIAHNLEQLGLSPRGTIIARDVRRALDELASAEAIFDLVFIDAPYKDDRTGEVLDRLVDSGLIAGQAWIVAEQYRRAPAPVGRFTGELEPEKVVTIGDHRIAFYRRMPNGCDAETVEPG